MQTPIYACQKNVFFITNGVTKVSTLILIPPYYANAYLCLSNNCVFHYKWFYKGKYIDSKKQKSYRWNDPKIKIKWPIKKPILSKRDKTSKFL